MADKEIGDDALAAGMDLVSGAVDASTIDTEINLTRDYIAQRTAEITPVDQGGTAATTPEGARVNLGVIASNVPTGGGASNVQADIDSLNQYKLTRSLAEYSADFAVRDQAIAARLPLSGGVVSGNLFLPNAGPATNGYTAAYINGDGRISRGASSRRYKDDIHDADELGDLFTVPLREFVMIGGDDTRIVGYIAEELDDEPQLARFVVRVEGTVESIDFIQLLLAQVAQLHARVTALEARDDLSG